MLQSIVLASLAGLLLPLQSLINARMAGAINGPMMAALVNFVGGSAALLLLIFLFRVPWPTAEQTTMVPAYGWLTGLFGAFFVAQAAFTIPKLGAAGMVALVVTGQMIGSVVMDHFGIMQPVQPITLQKAVGAVLLMTGVILILRPGQ
jgi:transporter family-2 protein